MCNRPTVLDQGVLHSIVIDVFRRHWLFPFRTEPFFPVFHAKKFSAAPPPSFFGIIFIR